MNYKSSGSSYEKPTNKAHKIEDDDEEEEVKTSTSTKKLKVEVDDAYIPFPDKGGHSVYQLKNFPEHKRKAILGEKDSEFLKKYS